MVTGVLLGFTYSECKIGFLRLNLDNSTREYLRGTMRKNIYFVQLQSEEKKDRGSLKTENEKTSETEKTVSFFALLTML